MGIADEETLIQVESHIHSIKIQNFENYINDDMREKNIQQITLDKYIKEDHSILLDLSSKSNIRKERLIGFIYGVVASIVASIIYENWFRITELFMRLMSFVL